MNQEYFREYYAKNRTSMLAKEKERWKRRTAEEVEAKREYMRQYRLLNPEKWKRTPEETDRRNARRRERYATEGAEREKLKKAARVWWHAHPEKKKEQHLRKFGMSLQNFKDLLAAQGGACAICGHSDLTNPMFFPVVDHCHRTREVRGLLCANCNHMLGKAKDIPARLRRAAEYLETNGSCGAA